MNRASRIIPRQPRLEHLALGLRPPDCLECVASLSDWLAERGAVGRSMF